VNLFKQVTTEELQYPLALTSIANKSAIQPFSLILSTKAPYLFIPFDGVPLAHIFFARTSQLNNDCLLRRLGKDDNVRAKASSSNKMREDVTARSISQNDPCIFFEKMYNLELANNNFY